MNKYWGGAIRHIEVRGCIINIREGLLNSEGQEVTSIEILSDEGWELLGCVNNRVIKKEEGEK